MGVTGKATAETATPRHLALMPCCLGDIGLETPSDAKDHVGSSTSSVRGVKKKEDD